MKENLAQVYINSADLIDYTQQDGSSSKVLLIKIPYRSMPYYRKASEKIINHLEGKFNWPVIVIVSRNIQSKKGISFPATHDSVAIHHKSQQRPRSRTLTTVYEAILEDIVNI